MVLDKGRKQSVIRGLLVKVIKRNSRKVKLLEPNALKVARSVLRGERGSDAPTYPTIRRKLKYPL